MGSKTGSGGFYIGTFIHAATFNCPNCDQSEFELLCSSCGFRQKPSELFGHLEDEPFYEMSALQSAIEVMRGHRIRLWTYIVSHSQLSLAVAYLGERNRVARKAFITCSAAKMIRVPTSAWTSDLNIEQTDGGDFRLVDAANDVVIEWGGVRIYMDAQHSFCGDVPHW